MPFMADRFRPVFCGEGQNEMLNDYGIHSEQKRYPSNDIGNTRLGKHLLLD
jgi:hypothetical protein